MSFRLGDSVEVLEKHSSWYGMFGTVHDYNSDKTVFVVEFKQSIGDRLYAWFFEHEIRLNNEQIQLRLF